MSYEIDINDEKRYEQLTTFMEKARKQGTVTFREVEDTLSELEFDVSQKDAVYDDLEASGVEVMTEANPEDFEIIAIEPERGRVSLGWAARA